MKIQINKYVLVLLTIGLIFGVVTAPAIAGEKHLKVAAISGYFAQGLGKVLVNGLEKAGEDFDVDIKLVDTGTRSLDYEEQFTSIAKNGEYDLVFVMGWELVNALEKTAKAYPEQKFIFIDGVLENDNMVYIDFTEEEGSFLVGAMAAMMTTRTEVKGINSQKKLGFIGGRDIPVIRNFLTGYEQGAKYIDPDVQVKAVFAGSFDDPARGNELAMASYSSGVDIIFNVAGPTGEGVLMAAKNARKFAIGVDIDQCTVSPGYIMGSMLKFVDNAVYDIIKDAVNGIDIKPGIYNYNIAKNGVDLCHCEEMNKLVPNDVQVKLEEIKEAIKSGKIKVKSVM